MICPRFSGRWRGCLSWDPTVIATMTPLCDSAANGREGGAMSTVRDQALAARDLPGFQWSLARLLTVLGPERYL